MAIWDALCMAHMHEIRILCSSGRIWYGAHLKRIWVYAASLSYLTHYIYVSRTARDKAGMFDGVMRVLDHLRCSRPHI